MSACRDLVMTRALDMNEKARMNAIIVLSKDGSSKSLNIPNFKKMKRMTFEHLSASLMDEKDGSLKNPTFSSVIKRDA